ncbi:MAG: YdcF family protein [Candidatus Syntrophonatronum acetioxidans]|uniref:YdcF family protein n=1 Tax=Candidatus Syntrophonatronum acetioxidans TaxID=1795816 RepID=A0A424YES1_9FIRM|nr:MAG: YdcF family protein [Candidatus Syntrophonatronum acetioxidans]
MVKTPKRKGLFITGFLIFFLLLFLIIFIPRAGHLLVAEDSLEESDIIVVLMGSLPERVLEGVDVFHQGYAPRVVMFQTDMRGYEDLYHRGVEIPDQAALSAMAAEKMGVPGDRIEVIECGTLSTQDEAVCLRNYLKNEEGTNSVILVTSNYHSARSKIIFEKALEGLDREVEVISRPSRYDAFDPQGWWKDREDAKRVVMEYIKFIHFYLLEQFKL